MKIGILSDTHNNQSNVRSALEILRQEQVDTLFHCGDITELETTLLLVEFRVICTFGNGDWNAAEIRQNLLYFRADNVSGISYEGNWDGIKIAATHGHLPGILENQIQSGEFDYVFHGHSHLSEDRQAGRTRVINPGALGGLKREPRGFAILDLESGKLERKTIDG